MLLSRIDEDTQTMLRSLAAEAFAPTEVRQRAALVKIREKIATAGRLFDAKISEWKPNLNKKIDRGAVAIAALRGRTA